MKIVFLIQIASTLIMVGIIWFAQIVHYPLLKNVGNDLPGYQLANITQTALIVGPVMLTEAFSALFLLLLSPEQLPPFQIWLGLFLLFVIYLSTAFLQVPQHKILAHGFNLKAYRTLTRTNWIRTLAWTARGVNVIWMIKYSI